MAKKTGNEEPTAASASAVIVVDNEKWDSLLQEMEEMRVATKTLRDENVRLSGSIQKSETKTAETQGCLGKMNQQMGDMQAQLELLDTQNTAFRSAVGELGRQNEALDAQVGQLRVQVDLLTDENLTLRSTVTDLEQQNKELRATNQELSALRTDVDILTASVDRLQTERSALATSLAHAERQNKDKDERLVLSERALAKAQKELGDTRMSRGIFESQLGHLSAIVRQLLIPPGLRAKTATKGDGGDDEPMGFWESVGAFFVRVGAKIRTAFADFFYSLAEMCGAFDIGHGGVFGNCAKMTLHDNDRSDKSLELTPTRCHPSLPFDPTDPATMVEIPV